MESDKSYIDVWVMREYGAVQSWTKRNTLRARLEGTELEPFGFKKNGGEAVFKISGTGERVITVDLKTKKLENLRSMMNTSTTASWTALLKALPYLVMLNLSKEQATSNFYNMLNCTHIVLSFFFPVLDCRESLFS